MAEFFPCIFLLSLILKRGVKVGLKKQTLGLSHFCKYLSFLKIIQIVFLYTNILTLVKISAKLNNILGESEPKKLQKGPFHGCLISTKNFENF